MYVVRLQPLIWHNLRGWPRNEVRLRQHGAYDHLCASFPREARKTRTQWKDNIPLCRRL